MATVSEFQEGNVYLIEMAQKDRSGRERRRRIPIYIWSVTREVIMAKYNGNLVNFGTDNLRGVTVVKKLYTKGSDHIILSTTRQTLSVGDVFKVVEFNLEGFQNDLALNNARRSLAGEVTVLNVYPEKYSVEVRCGNATSFMSALCFGRLEKVGKVIVN